MSVEDWLTAGYDDPDTTAKRPRLAQLRDDVSGLRDDLDSLRRWLGRALTTLLVYATLALLCLAYVCVSAHHAEGLLEQQLALAQKRTLLVQPHHNHHQQPRQPQVRKTVWHEPPPVPARPPQE